MSVLKCLPIIFLMVGCATTPKPSFPDSQYAVAASQWNTINQCGFNGNISADTAALGKAYFESSMQNYSIDVKRWKAAVDKTNIERVAPTKEQCNALAIDIASAKRKIDIHNQTVDNNQQATVDAINSTRITNTYCSKIGTQLLCNTY